MRYIKLLQKHASFSNLLPLVLFNLMTLSHCYMQLCSLFVAFSF